MVSGHRKELIHVVTHLPNENNKGGICVVAYHEIGDSFIRICSSICSTQDQYSKKIGYRLALLEMQSLSGMKIPLHNSLRYTMNHGTLRQIINNFLDIR